MEHAETESSPAHRPLDPNWELYQSAEDHGILKIFTVRQDDDTLIGYITVFCNQDPHSRNAVTPVTDLIYIHPSHRGGRTFYRLIQFTEKCLRADRHRTLAVVSTVARPIGDILMRMGYSQTHVIHEKTL
jgi:GNAT superfamily N-acetyltransferase